MSIGFKRGDPHPINPLLFYWGVRGKGSRGPIFLTKEKLSEYRKNQNNLCKKWQAKNPDKRKRADLAMRLKRKGQNAANMRAWKKRNPDKWKEIKYRHHKLRLKRDMRFLLITRMRARIRAALKSGKWTKNTKTYDMLGCTPSELKTHIESLFKRGMCWEMITKIHIDHITPVASAKTYPELKSLFHYTNLQPLWAPENQSKGASLTITY